MKDFNFLTAKKWKKIQKLYKFADYVVWEKMRKQKIVKK